MNSTLPTLVFLLEEKSAKNMLMQIIPKIIDTKQIDVRYICFEGKSDLQKKLTTKLQHWNTPNSYFVVMQDLDNAPNCKQIKQNLMEKCAQSGKSNYLVRLACNELESFYFGDLQAVEKAFDINLDKYQDKAMYRYPDTIIKPSVELEKITQHKYTKMAGSLLIGQYMDSTSNTSPSFNTLIQGITKLINND
jgi:hypothetical protein